MDQVQPPKPYVGLVVDGFVLRNPDNPADPASWAKATARDIAAAKEIGKKEGVREAVSSEEYGAGARQRNEGSELLGLTKRTRTGTFADIELGAARLFGDQKKAARLGRIQDISGADLLQKAESMKGALSDKDVAFLKGIAPSINRSPAENANVARIMQWMGEKKASYETARQTWVKIRGSESAPGRDGLNFRQWWSQYGERNYPFPTAVEGYSSKSYTPRNVSNGQPNPETGRVETQPEAGSDWVNYDGVQVRAKR
jgi:hypothetical protein